MPDVAHLYEELLECHAATELAEAAFREAEKAMLETEAGRQYLRAKQSLAAAKAGEQEADAELRGRALAEYAEHGIKRPHPQVGIRLDRRARYEEEAALAWAQANKPDWIVPARVDKRRFEKYARAVFDAEAPLDFVQFEEIVTMTVTLNGRD